MLIMDPALSRTLCKSYSTGKIWKQNTADLTMECGPQCWIRLWSVIHSVESDSVVWSTVRNPTLWCGPQCGIRLWGVVHGVESDSVMWSTVPSSSDSVVLPTVTYLTLFCCQLCKIRVCDIIHSADSESVLVPKMLNLAFCPAECRIWLHILSMFAVFDSTMLSKVVSLTLCCCPQWRM